MSIGNVASSFTSPFVGFLLKLCATLAAAAFGSFGIGAKTRDDKGHLNRDGWVALVGLLIAALLGVSTIIYEYVSGQETASKELDRNQRLMLSVQRNLYPMRGLKAHGEMLLGDADTVNLYKKGLRAAISADPYCEHKSPDFACDPLTPPKPQHPDYLIASKSRLFPSQDSQMGRLFAQLYFQVAIVAESGHTKGSDRVLGSFEVDMRDAPRKNMELIYDFDHDSLVVAAYDIEVKDDFVAVAGAYSLVDFFPGFVGVSAGIGDWWCDKKVDAATCDSATQRFEQTLRPRFFDLIFPYNKSIKLPGQNRLMCDADDTSYLVTRTPRDVEEIDSFGNVKGEQLTSLTDLCTLYKQELSKGRQQEQKK